MPTLAGNFSAQEIDSITAAALDFHYRGEVYNQTIQKKPLVAKLEGKRKTFPGGKGDITVPVKGDFGAAGSGVGSGNDVLKQFTHDDTVDFYTPAGIMRVSVPWEEYHIGMSLTMTELKIDGISVTDTAVPESTSRHSRRQLTAIANLLEEKVVDFAEMDVRSRNAHYWGDGTSNTMYGIMYWVRDDPTTATVGGIDQSAKTWWRNRSLVGTDKITSDPANGGALMQTLQKEMRQLRRYGKGPDLALCGSEFLDALETEMRANGNYSDRGFSQGGDISVGTLRLPGVGEIMYDPTLDDMTTLGAGSDPGSKRCYLIDTDAIRLHAMENEWGKDHTPARPNNQFVVHRSKTYTGNICATQLNTSMVIEIA